ncbi:MAG: O-antigen ligase family protein [Bacteroidetes bacterium]|nr:O-antigen ligase family protein [Bacteroidota bacterium]MBU1718503.1 O-antigen ligase family protein [Bacteroidota bacterium]
MIAQLNNRRNLLFWAVGLIFVALNAILISQEFFYLPLLPVVLLVLYLFFFHLDVFLLIVVALAPASILLEDDRMSIGMALPTEPLLFGVMLLFFLKVAVQGYKKEYLRHPMTVVILLYLGWLLVTSFTSEMPLVSIKFLISKLWFIIPFYFLGLYLFKDIKNIKRFHWLYIITLMGVIIYTLFRHVQWELNDNAAFWVMEPFFKDHTSYGAIIAMFFPIVIGGLFSKQMKPELKIFVWGIALVFTAGLVFSYTRAAWVSVFAALMLLFAILLKMKFRTVLLLLLVGGAVLFQYSNTLFMDMEKNRQDSSTDLAEHVQSISNISSDASNLERLNRWACAFRMFDERPVFGWGPGTYQYVYGPFQVASEKTIISTNAGDMGNAHSEYIGPLSESGLPGMLIVIAMFGTALFIGLRAVKYAASHEIRLLTLVTLLGFFTYITHGIMNNYLDLDKASIPFWGFIAMFTAIDIHHSVRNREQKERDT